MNHSCPQEQIYLTFTWSVNFCRAWNTANCFLTIYSEANENEEVRISEEDDFKYLITKASYQQVPAASRSSAVVVVE